MLYFAKLKNCRHATHTVDLKINLQKYLLNGFDRNIHIADRLAMMRGNKGGGA